jgi:hypothetical protein
MLLRVKYVSGTWGCKITVTYNGGKTKIINNAMAQPSSGVWVSLTYNLGKHIELATASKIENIEIQVGSAGVTYELDYVQLTNDKYYGMIAGDIDNISSLSLTNLTEI